MKHRKTIDEIIKIKAEDVCNNGTILGGHNGPYYDYELPIRNISHWICTFSKYYSLTGERCYKSAVEKLSAIYSDPQFFVDGQSCVCRVKCGKDKTNGVMGQAWVIEGLLACARTLKDDVFYDKAVELFKVQRFDWKNGLWSVIETDGRDLGFDITFNHQLWFAAAGSEIIAYQFEKEIDKQIKRFLECSNKFFYIHSNGLIFHFLKYTPKLRNWRWFWRTYKNAEHGLEHNVPSLVYKEEGYHLFSVYAFAIIFKVYGDNEFFKREKVKAAIRYAFDEDFLRRLSNADSFLDNTHIAKKTDKNINAYGYPYNSPAFEFPFIDQVFGENGHRDLIDYLMDEQFRLTYNDIEKQFSKNTEDVDTLNARLYELVNSF